MREYYELNANKFDNLCEIGKLLPKLTQEEIDNL